MIRPPRRLRPTVFLLIAWLMVLPMEIAAQPIAASTSDPEASPAAIPKEIAESFAYGGKYAFLTAADGTRLRYAQWPPTVVQRANIIVLGGRGEFIEKYAGEVVGELRARGFAVFALDWRGQGRSERKLEDREKGHVGDFTEYRDDLALFMRQIVTPQAKNFPTVALAHSMGGNTVLRMLADLPTEAPLAAAVLAAPMTGLTNALAIRAALLLAPEGSSAENDYMVGFGKFGDTRLAFASNRVTRDPRRYAYTDLWFAADARLRLGGPTYRWMRAGFRSIALMADERYLKTVSVPILLLSAGQDQLVDSGTHERICAAMSRCRLVRFAAAKHEIMMELDPIRAAFWGEFDRFIGDVLAR